ncbi:MAG: hypothetical protein FK732_07260 [Asgard group archaeon]|nr:hypothetical protein [Asgard group archaeon]
MNLKKTILIILGLVTSIVGWGMWKEPHLDWNILSLLIVEELSRLANDPFAILGLMIMILGLWLIFVLLGPWTLISGVNLILGGDKEKDKSVESA